MLLYDKIIEALQELLPANFMITYNNNLDTDWSEILPEVEDELIHGVLRVDSGENNYVGNQTVKTENMRITFAIPNKVSVFKQAIEDIEGLKDTFNDYYIALNQTGTIARILVNGRSSGAIERINSVDWILTDLIIQSQTYTSLITSDDAQVLIKATDITGVTTDENGYAPLDVDVTNIVYDYASNLEAKILGTGQVPTNYGTGNQKQLILTVIPQNNKPIYKAFLEKEDNVEYKWQIKYNNGIITREFDAKLMRVNEEVPTGGTYVATITFLRTK